MPEFIKNEIEYYFSRLFKETYIKDIIERNHIEKVQEINDLINILATGIGSLKNASKIEAILI